MIQDWLTRPSKMWVANLPERADVDRMLEAKLPQSVIIAWLAEDCGYGEEAMIGRLKNYIAWKRSNPAGRSK